ncbi:hypothetical protein E2C01_064504 [Portunus trituberculatus]|uniref:Uncharacterized protein n=1 Tax=Portunus trituberculatus TaxID=210409 RepID=A0A5B7HGB4_PORTR|nr:hypothetical protein [Portunus trituberculatus]
MPLPPAPPPSHRPRASLRRASPLKGSMAWLPTLTNTPRSLSRLHLPASDLDLTRILQLTTQ